MNSTDTEPNPELTLTKTGGGRAKWVVALVALIVLGGVVYVGISGPSAAPTSTPNPAVAVASESPPAPTATPYPDNETVAIRVDPTAPTLYQFLGTALTLNGHGTLAILDPVGPDAYRGIYRIPDSQLGPLARIELNAVTASVSNDNLDRLGDWAFPLTYSPGNDVPTTIFSTGGGQTSQTLSTSEFQRLATNGYQLTVTMEGQAGAALMTIDVTINPAQFFPQEQYTLAASSGGQPFGFKLENFGPGAYDGQVLIPNKVLGKTISVTISAVSLSDVTSSPLAVGSWSLYIPRSPKDTSNPYAAHVALNDQGGPVAAGQSQILANGFYMSLGTAVQDGHVYLSVVLNARPSSTPLPTR